MKIDSIVLTAFRRFREPLVLDALAPGLNLFTGPNEAGKSTIAAALRAAFLERYKTSSVAHFAPWGMEQAQPSVELMFSIGGTRYQLRKSFLLRPRCELLEMEHGHRHEGEAAENLLAGLLGYDFTARGASRPETAGIPGLLWIEQGHTQALTQPAGSAAGHLREALTRVSGELSSGGDQLLERVARERGALLDARAGRPKGVFREAEEALAQGRERAAELHAAKAQFERDADRLAALRAAHAQEEQDPSWARHAQRAAAARAALAAAQAQRGALDRLQQERQRMLAGLELLHQQVARDAQDDAALAALDAAIAAAQAEHDGAAAAVDGATRALAQARAELAEAAQGLDAARRAEDIALLHTQLQRVGADLARTGAALAAVAVLREKMAALAAQESAMRRVLDARASLDALRQAEHARQVLDAQRATLGTRVRYVLASGAAVTLDGMALHGTGEFLVSAAARLDLPDGSNLTIEPGGADLPALAEEVERNAALRTRLLERLEAASLAQAEDQALRAAQAERELDMVRRELTIHAPQGIAVLQAEHDRNLAQHASLATQVADSAQPTCEGDTASVASPPLPLAAALARHAQCEARVARATEACNEARRTASAARATQATLSAQQALRLAQQADPARVEQRAARHRAMAETRAGCDALEREIERALRTLQNQQPEALEQDVARFDESARIAREEHEARRHEILVLQGRLEQAGATGLGEQHAAACAELERLQRRRDQLAQRARALDLLQCQLAQKQAQATQRLQAPLAGRLDHYLRLLFPQARLSLDATLVPGNLERDGSQSPVSQLSYGTQEQLGLLARLAYADLLKQAGRPTLIVLDDALVHTDDARREFLKRALFDASARHQILMFTCHGDAWRDLGVKPRMLGN